jgi:CIC family chloride channel protein
VDYARRLFRKIVPPRAETSAMGTTVVLAGVVGVGAALLVQIMEVAIALLDARVFSPIARLPQTLPGPWRFLGFAASPIAVAAVLLLAVYMIRRWSPECHGTGTDRVMSVVGRRGGYIRKRVIPVKAIATTLCIGAGGPLGLEGPVVHTGAALGSLAGRWFKMGVPNIRILVAAGAAAGLAAKYGAPIAGAVFSAELILGGASSAALLPLILASFLSVATRDAVLHGAAEYVIPTKPVLFRLPDYLLFVVLGVACGIVAVYFIKTVFATERVMRRLFVRWWVRALVGGLVIGLLAVIWPDVLFGPSLLTGAAVGALCARLASAVLPVEIAPSTCYVMAGMAGVVAGVMRAPLQAIIITFELAHDYSVLLPLMITCVVTTKVSELFEPDSVFTHKLVLAGEKLRSGMDFAFLESLTVKEIMEEDYVALPAGATIRDITEQVEASENRTFPVVGENGRLRGIVMLASLIAAGVSSQGSGTAPKVEELLEPAPIHLEPDDSLDKAWRTMGNYDYDCLPVCRSDSEGLIVTGICEKEAILEMHL